MLKSEECNDYGLFGLKSKGGGTRESKVELARILLINPNGPLKMEWSFR